MKQLLDIVLVTCMFAVAVLLLCATSLAVFATIQYIFYGVR